MATIEKSRVVRRVRILVVVACLTALAPPVAAEPGPVVYTPPVDAPVVDVMTDERRHLVEADLAQVGE